MRAKQVRSLPLVCVDGDELAGILGGEVRRYGALVDVIPTPGELLFAVVGFRRRHFQRAWLEGAVQSQNSKAGPASESHQ